MKQIQDLDSLLWLLLLAIVLTIQSYAQPNHAGILFNAQFEGQASGNGSIMGYEGQGNYNFHFGGQEIGFASNFQATRDTKAYLDRAGWAFRSHNRVRYFVPNAKGLFLQGGAYFGHVAYPDKSPTVHDGYTKRVLQPIAGAGWRYHDKSGAVTVNGNYLYQFRSALHGKTTDRPAWFVDGTTRGRRIGLETSVRIRDSPWRGLVNFSHAWSVYQRDARYYGDAAAKVKHRFTVTEISFGLAYQFGK